MTITSLKMQIDILVKKRETFKPSNEGKYPKGYWAIHNKIINLKRQLTQLEHKKNWNNFLAN